MVARKEMGKNITNSQNVSLFSFFLKIQTIGVQEVTCEIRKAEILRLLNNYFPVSDNT